MTWEKVFARPCLCQSLRGAGFDQRELGLFGGDSFLSSLFLGPGYSVIYRDLDPRFLSYVELYDVADSI